MKYYYIITLTTLSILFSGCTIKETDGKAMKVAKHTANSPLYALYGLGKATEAAFLGAVAGTAYVVTGGGTLTKSLKDNDTQDKSYELTNEQMEKINNDVNDNGDYKLSQKQIDEIMKN